LAQAGHEQNVQRPIGRPPAAVTQVLRFEECDRKHWPIPSATRRKCRACSAKGITRNVSMICEKCDVGLSVIPHAFGTTTPRQISETFQAIQLDLPT